MPKFVIKTIPAVKGKQIFRQLIVVDDSVDVKKLQAEIDLGESQGKDIEIQGQLDIYENGIEEKYSSSFNRIIGNMNRVSELKSLPKEKFKDVTTSKSLATEYEYKYGDLRCWSIKIPNGQLVILGGYKNDQARGFKEFRSLVKQYFESIKN